MIIDLAFMETSALESINVDKAFKVMIEEIFNKFNKLLEETPEEVIINDRGIDLGSANNSSDKKKKKCC